MRRVGCSRSGGLTLLESVLVIAIIATLAAMVTPMLSSAKMKALPTQCLSNPWHSDIANTVYVQDLDSSVQTASLLVAVALVAGVAHTNTNMFNFDTKVVAERTGKNPK